jgi:uncharacterized protein YggE
MEDNKNVPQSNNSLVSVIIFFVLLFIFAKWGPALPFSVLSQEKGEPLIVSGEGKVSVTPDIAKVSLGIQESGDSLKTVQESVNKKSQSLVSQLKKLGIDEKDIKTTGYNVYPNYDYRATPQRINGYSVSINYEVTIKNFDKVNDVLSLATSSGANIVGGVSFDLSPDIKKKKLQEARESAVKEAKDKAEGLAKAAGISLGRVINISEQEVGGPRPVALLEKSMGAPADTVPTQPNIQPGETEIDITVSLSFEIR